jgi:hypothetical protein
VRATLILLRFISNQAVRGELLIGAFDGFTSQSGTFSLASLHVDHEHKRDRQADEDGEEPESLCKSQKCR